MVVEIPLRHGLVAIVDDADSIFANEHWAPTKKKTDNTWYAARSKRRAPLRPMRILLHRAILGITDPKIEVDHINGNGLDCRRENMRQATRSQNSYNCRKHAGGTSRYKGVSWNKTNKKWFVQIAISVGGQRSFRYLGRFEDEVEGALAYDRAAQEMFGEFARLNFPEGA